MDDLTLRLAAIVDSSNDAIISTDLEGIIATWNAAATQLLGYTAEELIGQSTLLIVPPELYEEEWSNFEKVKAGVRIEHCQTQRLRKGGSRVELSLSISPIRGADGEFIGAALIARDHLLERQFNDARLKLSAIVESSDDAIIGKSLDGVITSWNAGAIRTFGYEPHEIIGHSVLRLIPRELHSEEPMIMARLRAGQRIEHYESVRVTKDGELIDVSLTISPIRGASGEVIGASKIARDITHQKRAEASLAEKEKLAAIARLAATIAHEVNNPLEAIMNLGYLLASDSSLSPQARSYAELLLRETQRASEITKRTLTFCRVTVAPAAVHIPKLLDSILTSKTKQIAEKAIQITTDVKGSGFAFGVAGELGQVFSNLIDNAIDALGRGGRLHIRTRDLHSEEGHICISVCDDGTGISREDVTRIFEPFFTTKTKGTGLGLWVSRDIIHKHGGTLRVRSNNSPHRHGTIFSVVLPNVRAIAEAPTRAVAAD